MAISQKQAKLLKVASILLKPQSPKEGPPVPGSWDMTWPGFLKRAVSRAITDPPWKTIPKFGLLAEIRREFEVVTGHKL